MMTHRTHRRIAAVMLACLCVGGCILRPTDGPHEPAGEAVVPPAAASGAPVSPGDTDDADDAAADVFSSVHTTAVPAEMPISYDVGLFSWDNGCLDGNKRAKLYMTIKRLGVTELYQAFFQSDTDAAAPADVSEIDMSGGTIPDFLHDLRLMGVDCYCLVGDPQWGTDPEGTAMLAYVRLIAAYNTANPEAPLKGICFDVEPYLTDAWDEDKDAVMRAMLSAHTRAYAEAREAGLRVIACLPVWYDRQGYAEEVKSLMRDACDEVALMNYNRNDEYGQIAFEVLYAETLDQPVTCIFEFQKTGAHGLREEETYYNLGVERAVKSFESLYRSFGYPKLKFAYHYLRPLLELMDA